jgi:hypothetical protein
MTKSSLTGIPRIQSRYILFIPVFSTGIHVQVSQFLLRFSLRGVGNIDYEQQCIPEEGERPI